MQVEEVKNTYAEAVSTGRRGFRDGRCRSVEFRKEQLRQLKKMYTDHKDEFLQALAKDLRKPELESMLMEIKGCENDIDHILKRIDKWTKNVDVPSLIPFDKSIIYNEPYGLVLIMGAWNYPMQLSMTPLHGAIASGNAAILKPSEVSPATADLIAKLLPQYIDKDCYQVVLGGVAETTELLKNQFDYIFYTGSPGVGKIVRDAANKHLTPCTLELGGKSPCYIDDSVDLDMAARRILWGKMVNLGQTCIAPDYLICSKEMQSKFVNKAKQILLEWYGENPKESDSLSRIVAERHVERLASLLEGQTIAHGGKYDKESRWMEPTILTEVSLDSKVMKQEIFGPILPIINFENYVDAMEYINKGEKPLALYVFTSEKELQDMFLSNVSAGGVCINDTIFHAGSPNLPFGGVGNSGMGAYHGKYSFDTFTHKKSVLSRSYNGLIEKAMKSRFPPYTPGKQKLLTSQGDQGDGQILAMLKTIFTHGISAIIGAALLYAQMTLSKDEAIESTLEL